MNTRYIKYATIIILLVAGVVFLSKILHKTDADELTHNTEAVFTSLLNAIGLHPVFIH